MPSLSSRDWRIISASIFLTKVSPILSEWIYIISSLIRIIIYMKFIVFKNKMNHSLILPFILLQRRLIWWSMALWLNKKHMTILLNSWLDSNISILKELVFQYKNQFIFSVANDVFGITEKFLADTNILFYC